jgi:heptosyltransferase III
MIVSFLFIHRRAFLAWEWPYYSGPVFLRNPWRKLPRVKRFSGEALPDQSKIAVIANDAIGNFVVTTPLMQMLRSRYPQAELHFFGGSRTWEFQKESDSADQSHILHGLSSPDLLALMQEYESSFDFVFNAESTAMSKVFAGVLSGEDTYVAGPCVGPGWRGDFEHGENERGRLWSDKRWIAPDLTERYPFLQSGFIGEIFCRLAYLEGPLPPYRVPSEEPGLHVPPVLIATAASLPEKLWDPAKWRYMLKEIAGMAGRPGLIGASPADQRRYWKGESLEDELVREGLVEDLRGRLTLPQVVGALAKAGAVVTIDNGILHLAVSTGVPTVGLYRHGIHRLWAPPYDNLKVITSGDGGAVFDIPADEVLEAVLVPGGRATV